MLAEPVPEVDQEQLDKNRELKVVGAVNLTALVDSDVLRHLQGAHEYLYVSGMAVDADYRLILLTAFFFQLKGCYCLGGLIGNAWIFNSVFTHALFQKIRRLDCVCLETCTVEQLCTLISLHCIPTAIVIVALLITRPWS